MQLIGLYDSPYVRRVAISMRLLGLPFEHIALSVFRHQDEMRKINPLLKVPVLVLDNGERLIDSTFILDYLDDLAPPEKRLVPASGEGRRIVQQQCAIALVATEKTIQAYYETTLRPSAFSYAPWIDRCIAQMHDAFSMIEAQSDSGLLTGARITQADITKAVALRFARHVHGDHFPRGRYPCLDRLSDHCETLPAFVAAPLE